MGGIRRGRSRLDGERVGAGMPIADCQMPNGGGWERFEKCERCERSCGLRVKIAVGGGLQDRRKGGNRRNTRFLGKAGGRKISFRSATWRLHYSISRLCRSSRLLRPWIWLSDRTSQLRPALAGRDRQTRRGCLGNSTGSSRGRRIFGR